MKKMVWLLLSIFALSVSSCTIPNSTTNSDATSTPSDDESITITDDRNQQLRLDQPAQRIVTFPVPAPFILATIAGNVDNILGIHSSSLQAVQEGMMHKIYPELLNKETNFVTSGFTPNIEELLKLEPDLVIQWANQGEGVLNPLDQAGLKTLGLNYGDQTDLEHWMRLFGQIIGQEERAQQLIEYQQQQLQALQTSTDSLQNEQKPTVLYLSPLDNLRVFGAGTYNDEYFGWTGARNSAADITGMQPISIEQIIAWNPDIIYIGNFSPHVPDDILQNKLAGQDWSSITAVKNKAVYKVPLGGYRWDPPNQESPLMWQWLLTIQHPDLVDFDLRQNIKDFYQTWYDYQLTEEEIDTILRCDVNASLAVCE